MAKLSTHVLDTMHGLPAKGVQLELYALTPERKLIKKLKTNADGRTDKLLLKEEEMEVGQYEIIFHTQKYFKSMKVKLEDETFLDDVPIRFSITDKEASYHVPLLVSPWSYSTYKGS